MLRGNRINLRTVRRADLPKLLELRSEVRARGQYYPMNLPSEVSLINSFEKDGMWGSDDGTLLVVDKNSDRIMGSVFYFNAQHYYDAAKEVGYILYDPADRGKGYGTEALGLLVDYLFDWLNLARIQIQVELDNTASRRLAEKCGFEQEGIMRHVFYVGGAPQDVVMYAKLRGAPGLRGF